VAQSARHAPAHEESPPVDSRAVDRAYRAHRARRQAIIDRRRRTRRARVRFWVVLVLLAAASFYLALTVWHQVQRLFGL